MENNWYVTSILKGVRRIKGDSSNQKLPITLDVLTKIFSRLNLNNSFDRIFWTTCIVAFFSFFRKSNLLIPSVELFDPTKHLCAADVLFAPQEAIVVVRWSKVIQFQERVLHIPLPRIPDSIFCPCNALLAMTLECPSSTVPVPLFRYKDGGDCIPLTQAIFTSKLHSVLQALGFPRDQFSAHSFRRGGAQYALQCGLPVDLIKVQGDWRSNACERYLQPSLGLRRQVASTMGSHVGMHLATAPQHWLNKMN